MLSSSLLLLVLLKYYVIYNTSFIDVGCVSKEGRDVGLGVALFLRNEWWSKKGSD